MKKTFTIEEIKTLYDMYFEYAKEWSKVSHDLISRRQNTKMIMKQMLVFKDWLDVYEQGNDELIYY